MTWDEIKQLGPLYALGVLDEDSARNVEDYLSDATPEQRREIAEWCDVVALIPLAMPSRPVPEHLRESLLSRIAAETQSTPVVLNETELHSDLDTSIDTSTESFETSAKVLAFTPVPRAEPSATRWLLIAASVLLSLTSGYLLWHNIKLNSERNELAIELERVRSEVKGITGPETRVIQMSSKEAPQATAKLVWDTTHQTWVIYIYNLPVPPTDKQYQLWYVKKDAKISAAVFDTSPQGEKVLKITLPPNVVSGLAAAAVTLEPKGGSQQPTTTPVLVGAI
ncbi:MAG: anti-sigma factor [Acidobacteria bacterium]|nr:anti-sigma factor [Acidobacteriota bacterium]